jgi:hypothetical protein
MELVPIETAVLVSFRIESQIYFAVPSLITIVSPEAAMVQKPVDPNKYHNCTTCKRTAGNGTPHVVFEVGV